MAFNSDDRATLERVERLLQSMLANQAALHEEEMAKIDDVESAVAAERSVEESAITLLNNLTQMIKDAGTDPARLQAVVDSINTNKQALADAVAANTPATGPSTS